MVAAAALLTLLGLHAIDANSVIFVDVNPPDPSEADPIEMVVSGDLPYPCFELSSSHVIAGNIIQVTVEATPFGQYCAAVITPFSVREPVGVLPAGSYTAQASVYITRMCSPCIAETTFEIEPAPTSSAARCREQRQMETGNQPRPSWGRGPRDSSDFPDTSDDQTVLEPRRHEGDRRSVPVPAAECARVPLLPQRQHPLQVHVP